MTLAAPGAFSNISIAQRYEAHVVQKLKLRASVVDEFEESGAAVVTVAG